MPPAEIGTRWNPSVEVAGMEVREFIRKLRNGTLSLDEIGRGMHKSFMNACELIEDAETLLEKRPGRAISLAVLAIEEIAKIVILASAAARAAGGPVKGKIIQREMNLHSHRNKLTLFTIYGSLVLDLTVSGGEKQPFYKKKLPAGLVPLLNLLKQWGFYVDIARDQFMSPDEFGQDNREWADCLIDVAKERLESFEPLHGSVEKSVALAHWVAKLAKDLAKTQNETQVKETIRKMLRKQVTKPVELRGN